MKKIEALKKKHQKALARDAKKNLLPFVKAWMKARNYTSFEAVMGTWFVERANQKNRRYVDFKNKLTDEDLPKSHGQFFSEYNDFIAYSDFGKELSYEFYSINLGKTKAHA